ncbi:ABC transporter permease [Rhizobium sp. BK376]|uniref:ABC transporter permease n=1 Tax=Rhizobium sp. BK376 TaxID=2512149 RepID=UPI00104E9A71|nr:ABC transporter permease [Rhizobium sp. BK376]TCR80737.1 simple sugar transport system permease protein/ribose transport system permease protein [Rhizobium sp. BK376]
MRNWFSEERGAGAIFVLVACALAAALAVQGTASTQLVLFSILQYFATIAPVALGLGLTMVAREFDLSVGGVMSLSGCIAVTIGAGDPIAGAAAGIVAGLAIGLLQGLTITGLGLSSISVSLGTLMTTAGLAYIVTGNLTVSLGRPDLSAAINEPILVIFSWRSLFAVGCIVIAGLVFRWTRIGVDLVATGSERVAARTAGVKTGPMVAAVFTVSSGLAAASGVLLSYGLSVASPSGLTDVLVPAISAAIIGGVSLAGGRGSPVGIAFGALVLCLLNAGLNALGVSPTAQQVILSAVLFAVAISSAPRFYQLLDR